MIYDVTGKISGEDFPYSDGCVLIFRTDCGNVTVNFDPGISQDAAARALTILAEGLNKADSATKKATDIFADGKGAKNIFPETAVESAASAPADCANDAASAADFPDTSRPVYTSSSVNPEDVTEDYVRWRDGYTAYRMDGSWWWILWHDGANERWGMSGPLLGAIDLKKGPFDNFDETLASMMRHRAEIFSKNSYIG